MPFCSECNCEIRSCASHNRTTKHKKNCSIFLDSNLKLVQTAFKHRILTYHISSDIHLTDVKLYLEELKPKIINLLNECMLVNQSLRVNVELYGRYMLASTKEEEIKSFNTKYALVYDYTNLDDFFEGYKQALIKKTSEFTEASSGWALSKLLFLELNINKYIQKVGVK